MEEAAATRRRTTRPCQARKVPPVHSK